MRANNPFVFLVQILLDIVLVPVNVNKLNAGTDAARRDTPFPSVIGGIAPTLDDSKHLIFEPGISRSFFDELLSSTVTSPFRAIKRRSETLHSIGHGSTANMRANNPFVFLVQVSKRFCKSYRSNNVCLILLPCPRSCYLWLCDVFFSLRMLLLLSGDVEVNPGPETGAILQKLKEIARDIQEIKNEKGITNDRLSAIEHKLESLSTLQKNVSACRERITELETTVKIITRKVDDLENRSRRSNLIVYGIKEQENENSQTLERVVVGEILERILNVQIAGIERIHRLGKQADNKIRQVILKLLDSRDKSKILKNCVKLKGTDFSIGEDFSRHVQQIRKKLWDRTKANRDKREKVFLTYDKVRINGHLYAWDETKEDIIPVEKNDVPDEN
ncbi:uncharacterized protein LOC115328799 [Ixodes scapularis]|uniref:uncharacterized protein LOC115328799 n=1 Tax=Ixodes scapularis TaxID=6945 RepID=UPI001A9ECE06|nr:uncharacterized protein LOC115328799 [Ixodes scapularis]